MSLQYDFKRAITNLDTIVDSFIWIILWTNNMNYWLIGIVLEQKKEEKKKDYVFWTRLIVVHKHETNHCPPESLSLLSYLNWLNCKILSLSSNYEYTELDDVSLSYILSFQKMKRHLTLWSNIWFILFYWI
jgi:hypothetical protein